MNHPELVKRLESELSPAQRESLMQEMPKAEALLANQAGLEREDRTLLVRNYGRLCALLNRQLALVCQSLGYGLEQSRWPDSQPLETLDSIYSHGLSPTEWFQNQLGEILMPTGHPLTHLAITI